MNIDSLVYIGFTFTVLAMGLFAGILFKFVISFITKSSLNSDKTFAEKHNQTLFINQFIYFFVTASFGFVMFILFANFMVDNVFLNTFTVGISASLYVVSALHLTEGLRLRHVFKQQIIANIKDTSNRTIEQKIAYTPLIKTARYYLHAFFTSLLYISLYIIDGDVNLYMITFICLYICYLLLGGLQYVRGEYLTEKIIFNLIRTTCLYILVIVIATFVIGAERTSLFVIGVQAINYILWSGALMLLVTSDNAYIHYKNSVKDPLTGAYNRRHFVSQIQTICHDNLVNDNAIALIICDIDNFKNINDKYGHDVGDSVIQQFAQRLQSQLHESNVLSRIGGEEFAIILPHTDLATAQQIAENMRKCTEDLPMNINDNEQISITGSFGVTAIERVTANYSQIKKNNEYYYTDKLYNNADEAMYYAKETGKNTVTAIMITDV